MKLPGFKKSLKTVLSSIQLVVSTPGKIMLSFGLLSLAAPAPGVAKTAVSEPRVTIDRRNISKYSTKYLLRSAATSVGNLFAQHRSHSSHSSHTSHYSGSRSGHVSHSSHSSHSSHYSSSYPVPTPSHSSHSSHYSSSGTVPTPRVAVPTPDVELPASRPRTTKSTVVLSDYFASDSLSRTKWKPGSLTAGPRYIDEAVTAVIQDSRLTVTPRAGVTGRSYNGWITSSSWNMTATHARVEVSQVTNGAADTIFAIGTDDDNWYGFVFEGGKLYLQAKISGKKNSTSIAYSAVRHRFWRLRHEATLDQILWETSADGQSWAVVRSAPKQIDLSHCYIYLGAGTYLKETDPGVAVFDSFRLVAHSE